MDSIYSRTEIILGSENVERIKRASICVCGVGGVGSYVLEALARVGIGNICVIDKDIVDITNINRQLIALNSTIGENKVDAAVKRAKDINKDLKIEGIKESITFDNIDQLLSNKFDYVIDCVDNIEAKTAIIKYCWDNKIKCISSMGMGNKLNPLDIKVADIYKTEMDPLSKIMRKKLKEIGIRKQKVVYSVEKPKKNNTKTIGSVSFVPSAGGLVIASEVVKDIIK